MIQISTGIWSGETIIEAIRVASEKAVLSSQGTKPVLSALMSETNGKTVTKTKTNTIPCFAFPETPGAYSVL